ncbi:MAG: DUF2270 domain-containing protein [Anaerolineales bacterium]
MVDKEQDENSKASTEPVWTYRGYQLKASEFTTAMVHLFRAEVTRANVWRQRLDTTTNWAVVTTGASISLAFTGSAISHIVLMLNLLLVTIFLLIETRRYRYYELWSSRIRLMETDFFAAMLVPPFHPSPDWAEALAENLLLPHFPISNWEAFGRRLRRNYLWIYVVVGSAWMAKLTLFPIMATSFEDVLRRASIGPIRGEWILISSLILFVTVFIIAMATVGLQRSSGEVLPRFEGLPADFLSSITEAGKRGLKPKAWFRPASQRRKQLLTFIITDRPDQVSDAITRNMNRGATVVSSHGAYTGKEHAVLLVALTVTEVSQMKALVAEADPNAFVIVSPAQSIFGKGFMPLEKEE